MICEKCHQEYDGNMSACPYCGNATPQPQYGQPQYGQPQYGQPQQPYQQYPQVQGTGRGLSVASMVCGIIGLVLCWVPFFGLVMNALAIIFYILSRKETPNGMAVAGLVCGIIGIIIALIITILIGIAWSAATNPLWWF